MKLSKQQNLGASSLPILVLVLIVLVLAGSGFLLWDKYGTDLLNKLPSIQKERTISIPKSTSSPSGVTTPKASGTPTPLKQGQEVYFISQSSTNKGPKITQATLNPLDPKKGEQQTIRIKTFYSSAIQEVKITLASDSKTQTLPPLKLVSGTNLDGEWEVTWTVDDTVLYKYILTITATGGGVKSSIDLAIRS